MERLREDPTIPEIFGMEAVVSDDTVRRFFKSIDPAVGAEWVARHARPMWRALPEQIILDWDSTVQPKYGHQDGAEIGYNPIKPGRRSFHPLLAVVSGTRLCPAYRFRSGDTVTSTQWEQTMEDARRWLSDQQRVWLNRGDLGLGHDAVMRWHEQERDGPYYLFKLKLTSNVRTALHQVPESHWQGPANMGPGRWPMAPCNCTAGSRLTESSLLAACRARCPQAATGSSGRPTSMSSPSTSPTCPSATVPGRSSNCIANALTPRTSSMNSKTSGASAVSAPSHVRPSNWLPGCS
ncbi:MAG: transposase [Opitutaceae bacterium]|nr:transposase [Opitutaceae bacterium]